MTSGFWDPQVAAERNRRELAEQARQRDAANAAMRARNEAQRKATEDAARRSREQFQAGRNAAMMYGKDAARHIHFSAHGQMGINSVPDPQKPSSPSFTASPSSRGASSATGRSTRTASHSSGGGGSVAKAFAVVALGIGGIIGLNVIGSDSSFGGNNSNSYSRSSTYTPPARRSSPTYTAPAPQRLSPFSHYVTARGLNARFGPGTNHRVAFVMGNGNCLRVTGIFGNWAKFQAETNMGIKELYAHKNHIRRVNPRTHKCG